MSSLFATGAVAEGCCFIGRSQEVEHIMRSFYVDHKNVAVVGLPRIGKTSIVTEVCRKIQEKMFLDEKKDVLIMIDLAKEQTFESAWQSIIIKIYDKLIENGITHRVLESEYTFFSTELNISYNRLKLHAERFLNRLKKIGVHIYLIIDEFDSAIEKFAGERYYYEYFRDIASTSNYDLNLMLISRQLIKQIEANAYGNSTLFGIFDDVIIREFSENDLNLYYNILEQNNCFLDQSDKNKLNEIAGRSPYLLSIFGDHLLNSIKLSKKTTITDIYVNIRKKCMSYFEALMHQLENDKNLIYILEIVIGPKYRISKTDIDDLESMGYLSYRKIKNDYGDEQIVWQIISEAFVGYLKLNCVQKDVWPELMETQKIIVELMKQVLPRVYKENPIPSNSIEFNNMLDKGNSRLSTELFKKFVFDNKIIFDVDTTYLDVAGIKPLALEMQKYWDDNNYGFRYFFDDKPYEYWCKHFDRMHNSRNACAHDHPEFLSENDIKTTNLYCLEIRKALQKNMIYMV